MSQQHRLNTQLRPYIQPTANAQMYKCPADLIDWPPSILHFVPASREDYQDGYIHKQTAIIFSFTILMSKAPFCGQSNWQTFTILVLGSPKSRTHTPSVKEQNSVKPFIHFVLGELWFSLSSIYQNLFLIIQRAHNTSNIFPLIHGL
jgi:hypothetical protein